MENEEPKAEPKPEWKYKDKLPIQEQMKTVVNATISVAQTQVDGLRRKLDKLTYGA